MRPTEEALGADEEEDEPAEAVAGEPYTLPQSEFKGPQQMEFESWKIDGSTYKAGESVKLYKDSVAIAQWSQVPDPKPGDGGIDMIVVIGIAAVVMIIAALVLYFLIRRPKNAY